MLTDHRLSAHSSARLLRAVGLDLTRRVNHRLPGIASTFTRRVVVCVDGNHIVGALGSYTSPAWRLAGEYFDNLTINVRHASHQAIDPAVYARNILTTLAHEIAHAYTPISGLIGTTGPGRMRHTEDFALVAVQLGLRVVRHPEHPTVVFTPDLSVRGRIEFADLIDRIAASNLARTSGIAYAGPQRFHDLVGRAASAMPDPASSSSHPFTR